MPFPKIRRGKGNGRDGTGSVWRSSVRKRGAQFLARMVETESVCLRRLGGKRSGEVRWGRLLSNKKVSISALIEGWSIGTARASAGRHVLALQDTTEVHFSTTPEHRRGLGPAGKGNAFGLMVHPVLAIDAETGLCHGLAGGSVWTRRGTHDVFYRERERQDRESIRWTEAALIAQKTLATAARVTMVADREADIFALWATLQTKGMDAIIRSNKDRVLANGYTLDEHLARLPEVNRQPLTLRERASRPARKATLALRFGEVEIVNTDRKNKDLPRTLTLRVIEVKELDPPQGMSPLHWRLLTTHAVEEASTAWQIVRWYAQRWHIEQLFRTMKQQGLRLEDSQISDAARLTKLAAVATRAACLIMQLVLGRDGRQHQDAETLFSPQEMQALHALLPTLEGKTLKQKNPHSLGSVAWASWIIARLGGWNGYASYKPPGPITFRYGLERFLSISLGLSLKLV